MAEGVRPEDYCNEPVEDEFGEIIKCRSVLLHSLFSIGVGRADEKPDALRSPDHSWNTGSRDQSSCPPVMADPPPLRGLTCLLEDV
ncbi:Protein spire like 2 [Dissostichus eleginoides]|uniref:Protein spire like 2 n=1 Tax=Dissostichus eleginoides TaxID=100907 RepID=A0AAD9ET64_DISEL|nr:Protein spire like 2 [Dissostichus eleginoides]